LRCVAREYWRGANRAHIGHYVLSGAFIVFQFCYVS
jgi:hypothetical protein